MLNKGKATENHTAKKGPDCCTCIRRKECDRYSEGSWCTRWQSREAEDRKPDPNEEWMKGGEAPGV